MKTVVCTKTGNTKSISVGSQYNVLAETEKRYSLVNNKGIQTNYCKSLFTEVPVATGTPVRPARVREVPVPVEAPVIPRVQFDEIDITVNVDYDSDEEHFNIDLIATGINNYRRESSVQLNESGCSISCGIFQLSGINNLLNTISMFKSNIFTDLRGLENTDINITEEDINTADILESVINEVVENAEDTGLIILSTNVTSNNSITEEYIEVLDRMSASTVETENPNSNNRIKMWTLQITE